MAIKLFIIILIASIAAAIGDEMVTILEQVDTRWLVAFRRLFEGGPGGAVDAVTSRLGFLWMLAAVSMLLAGAIHAGPHR